MKRFRAVLMAVVLLAAATAPVKADWTLDTFSGGSHFATTASISLQAVWNPSISKYEITVYVMNLGTDGELYKAIGLIGIPAGVTVEPWGSSYAPTGYGPPPPNDLSGDFLPVNTWGYSASSQGYMLANGGSGTFKFLAWNTGIAPTFNTDVLGVGIHAISGPNGCSSKFGVVNGEEIPEHLEADRWTECSSTVVPEPSTVVLLGTGLAGLFGVAWRRRREDED